MDQVKKLVFSARTDTNSKSAAIAEALQWTTNNYHDPEMFCLQV